MPHEVDPNLFDDAARTLIRKTLLKYMQANAIGVPALVKRMEIAEPAAISIKTLQRFLSGMARTDDRVVALYHRFAERQNANES